MAKKVMHLSSYMLNAFNLIESSFYKRRQGTILLTYVFETAARVLFSSVTLQPVRENSRVQVLGLHIEITANVPFVLVRN